MCFVFSLFVMGGIGVAEISTDKSMDSYSFNVKIENYDVVDIISVTGLGIEISLVEKLSKSSPLIELSPGNIKFRRITLKKIFSSNSFFNDWSEKALAGKGKPYLKNISITLLGYSKNEDNFYMIQRWTLYECFPVVWELSPLRIDSDQDLVESLVVACNGLKEETQL